MSRKLGFLGRSIGLPGPVSLRFCELFCCPFYLRLVMYRIVVYIKRGDHEPPEEEHKNGGDEKRRNASAVPVFSGDDFELLAV